MTCQILAISRPDVAHKKCDCTCYDKSFNCCSLGILKLIDIKQYFYNGV